MVQIKGFSNYFIDDDGKVYSQKSGVVKLLKGSLRDSTFRLTADSGAVIVTTVPKIRWCMEHDISPEDFPKGDFLVSRKFGVVDRRSLMQHINDEMMHKTWTKDEAIEELDQIMQDGLLQRQYYRDGDMTPLIARFMQFADEAKTRLVRTYFASELDVEIVMEREYEKFCQMIKRNYPIHSIKAMIMSGSYSRLKELQRRKRALKQARSRNEIEF